MAGHRILYLGFKRNDSILVGGGVANMRSLRALRQYFGEENVYEYYFLDEARGRSLWSYIQAVALFPFDYHNGVTPSKVAHVVSIAHQYDYVFLSTSVFGIVAKRLREDGYTGRIVTHYHNVESIYYDAQMPRWLPGRSVVVRCAARNDEYGCRYSDRVITLSRRDANYLEQHYQRRADAIVSISLPDVYKPVDSNLMTDRRPSCLFLGAYSKPNNDGVLFFVRNVLPHVDVRFSVVGKGMARLKQENPCMETIPVFSDVNDLSPFIEAADFMILPIFAGSGMKVKTCESLMYGKNIIASTESFEGYDLDPERVGGLCNTAEEYIETLRHYIDHPVPRLNQYSRQIFLDHHSEASTYATFTSVFD